MRFDSVKELKGEVFRRLTGIQRNTFEAMAVVLSDAKCKQKAAGGKPNTLSVENQLLMVLKDCANEVTPSKAFLAIDLLHNLVLTKG